MNSKHLCLAFFLSMHTVLNLLPAQCMDYIQLKDQDQVDAFPSYFPGCTEFTGSITIIAQQLTNLDSLIQLKVIHGELIIDLFSLDTTISFSGLDSITLIDGNLKVIAGGEIPFGLPGQAKQEPSFTREMNSSPVSFNGLNAVQTVTGNVKFSNLTYFNRIEGLEQLNHVNGNFTLEAFTNIDTLRGFNHLDSIDGALKLSYIHGPPYVDIFKQLCVVGGELKVDHCDLLDLSWIISIKSIDGNFTFSHNAKWQGGDPLNMLSHIRGDLHFEYCHSLKSLPLFSNLDTINGSVYLIQNDSLTSLEGFSNLAHIGGSLLLDGNGMETCSSLQNLHSIGGSLQIMNNPRLLNANGLSGISTLGGDLVVKGNNFMDSLNEFRPTHINGAISIEDNFSLMNLPVLDSITHIYSFVSIVDNPWIESLKGLEHLHSIDGDLNIEQNFRLKSLEEISALDSVGGKFTLSSNFDLTTAPVTLHSVGAGISISGNDELIQLPEFHFSKVNGDVWISGNNKIKSFSGLDQVTNIVGDVFVLNNDSLESLYGLNALQSIGGYFRLERNSLLSNLDDLLSLESIQGYMSLKFNHQLKSITGLHNLKVINGWMDIVQDSMLTSLAGLDQVDLRVLQFITIQQCPLLSYCATQSICQYFLEGGFGLIQDNLTGCNSTEEVISLCLVGTSNVSSEPLLSIQPNPVSETFQLAGLDDLPLELYLLDILGRRHSIAPEFGYVEVTHIPPGYYILVVQSGIATRTIPFIKN